MAPNSLEKKNKYTIPWLRSEFYFFLTNPLSKLGQNEVTQSLERKQILKQIAFAFSYSRIEAVGISNLLFKWETCNIFRPGGRHACSLSLSLFHSPSENPTQRGIYVTAQKTSPGDIWKAGDAISRRRRIQRAKREEEGGRREKLFSYWTIHWVRSPNFDAHATPEGNLNSRYRPIPRARLKFTALYPPRSTTHPLPHNLSHIRV